ncbi:MAG: hypothetical protein ACI8S6_003298 [Myxococcota bacterium]|jgi:hypothetical protein
MFGQYTVALTSTASSSVGCCGSVHDQPELQIPVQALQLRRCQDRLAQCRFVFQGSAEVLEDIHPVRIHFAAMHIPCPRQDPRELDVQRCVVWICHQRSAMPGDLRFDHRDPIDHRSASGIPHIIAKRVNRVESPEPLLASRPGIPHLRGSLQHPRSPSLATGDAAFGACGVSVFIVRAAVTIRVHGERTVSGIERIIDAFSGLNRISESHLIEA